MTYEVHLEVFEGPLDLLLHLITKQRVDIYDVSIATITDEYVQVLNRMETIDLEVATGFLVVASTLLELKSARLLPATRLGDGDDPLLEERDLLLARLVECATYREAGIWVNAGLAAGAGFHGRDAGLEPDLIRIVPDLLRGTSIDDLIRAASRAFVVPPVLELDVSHVQPIRASVRDAIVAVVDQLQGGTRTFQEICEPGLTRIDVVVRFLALLELYKAGAIRLEQASRFGDIRATWTEGELDADLLDEVDEYAMETEDRR
jgi:segregation and condensation protein A